MNKFLRLSALAIAIVSAQGTSWAQSGSGVALAIIVPGGGDYSRPSSIDSERAQQFFDQGLRMAWSFYFPESIASYQEASRLDPESPMPYFGLAHAAGPNPNSRYARLPDDPQGAGLEAIRNALSLANNGTEQESDMINALFVLYNKDAIPDQRERDFAYVDAMRSLHAQYPNDPDIATMFAEGYMNTTRWDYWNADGSAKPGTAEAQTALETAMRLEHDHPGANHLYIHLMEASSQPELAMPAAQKLESIVPISGHMVHMPGHIYLRVGEYEKAIDINERSQIVDLQFAEIWGDTNFPNIGTYGLSHKSHAPHALDFVRYANMLQGNYAEAYEASKRGADSVGVAVEAVNRGQKRVVNWWLTDKIFGKWDKILAAEQSHAGTPYLDGMWSYIRGSALSATGKLAEAETELSNIKAQAIDPAVDSTGVSPTPASHILALASFALEGEIKEAQGDLTGAIAAYTRAVELQDASNYTEPPDWSQSIRLYLGAALLSADRAVDAETVYRQELNWSQQNGWASFGLYQALVAQGRDQEAIIAKRQFESYWRNADVSLERSRL
jgi:tetratricopeptide (TPR) repeat protein